MLRRLITLAARHTPAAVKRAVHRNPSLYRMARRVFSKVASYEGTVAQIDSGPMAGLRLVISEHTSHAHISGTYERETQDAIDALVEPGSVCYDLGASIGYLSLLMARKAREVFAFEPAPHAVEEIRRHAEANAFRNITVVCSPVSDCERDVEFSLTDVAFGSCITSGDTPWRKLKLRTTTLDAFVSSHPFPDFIKIDVEGEEGRVLKGARSILREKRTPICCELHSEQCAREVLEILSEYGYRASTLNGTPFELHRPVIAGELQIIALPPGR